MPYYFVVVVVARSVQVADDEAHVSLEQDSLEPPMNQQLSSMGLVEYEQWPLETVVEQTHCEPHVSILQRLAVDDNVPFADDDDAGNTFDSDDVWNQDGVMQQHESSDAMDSSAQDSTHYYEDGHYWVEIAGLPPVDYLGPDESLFGADSELRKRPIRVRFTTDPIRGSSPFFYFYFATFN